MLKVEADPSRAIRAEMAGQAGGPEVAREDGDEGGAGAGNTSILGWRSEAGS